MRDRWHGRLSPSIVVLLVCAVGFLSLGAATLINLATQVQGVLGTANGGTGSSAALTSGGFMYASSTTSQASSALIADDVVPVSGGAGAAPTASSITDNGTDVVTTEPIYGGNTTVLTSNKTTTSASLASLTLALPAVPVNTNRYGTCNLVWEASATDNVVFGLNTSAAPTSFQLLWSTKYLATGTNASGFPIPAAVTTAVTTTVTASIAPTNSNTLYPVQLAFSLQTGATNPVTITVYGDITSGATLTLLAGSSCGWLP
jgi:hypothetical protein